MFCTKCGTQLPDNANFCHVCGQALMEAPMKQAAPQQVQSAAPQAPVQTVQMPPVQPVSAVRQAAAAAGAAKGGFGAAKLLITLLLIAALGGGVVVIYHQATADPADGIRETVADFEAAYNRHDMNALLECFDPAITSVYQGALSLVGDLAGFDISSLVDGLFGLAAVLPPEAVGVEYPHLDAAVDHVEFLDEYSADVTLTLTLSGGGETGSMTETMAMVRKDDTWYFSGEGLFW